MKEVMLYTSRGEYITRVWVRKVGEYPELLRWEGRFFIYNEVMRMYRESPVVEVT